MNRKCFLVFFNIVFLILSLFAADKVKNTDELAKEIEVLKKDIQTLQMRMDNIEKLLQKNTQSSSVQKLKVSSTADAKNDFVIDPVLLNKSNNTVQEIKRENRLEFLKREIKEISEGYFILLYFKTEKNEPFAEEMRFDISCAPNTDAVIKTVSCAKLKSGKSASFVSDDGKTAKLTCSLSDSENLVITIFVSNTTILNISGNNGLEPLNLDLNLERNF